MKSISQEVSSSSAEVWAAAAEDDPVNFDLHVSSSDHTVTQRLFQKQLLQHVLIDAAHFINVAQEVFKSWLILFFQKKIFRKFVGKLQSLVTADIMNCSMIRIF